MSRPAALRTVGELGGATIVPPTPINDKASFALFRDPAGNTLGLLQASGPIMDPGPDDGRGDEVAHA